MTEELDPKIYPIGKAQNNEFSKEVLYRSIIMVEAAPVSLRKRLETIAPQDLELSYRENGWTIRQIVHHMADSHMNMWIRFKHALTSDTPTIQPYDQNAWADSKDYKTASLESSLMIFEGIQDRFSNLLKHMEEDDFKRTYFHPEYNRPYTLGEVAQLYAWHSMHHVAQIEGIFKQ
ncbi:MAG: putative metal-dependent hydrolase [Bacteroidota bacterium]